MERFTKIIKEGYWIYNERVVPVYIIIQNWDFFYEEGYDEEPPDLNKEGIAYYIIFDKFETFKNANRSETCLSEKEVISLAEMKVSSKIYWNNIGLSKK